MCRRGRARVLTLPFEMYLEQGRFGKISRSCQFMWSANIGQLVKLMWFKFLDRSVELWIRRMRGWARLQE